MSTAAQEPNQVGPRRAGSSSEVKVTPRRNATDPSAPYGIQYDGDEVPVLIRLPDLRDLATSGVQSAPEPKQRQLRIDSGSRSETTTKPKSSNRSKSSKKSKRSIEPDQNNTKLVVGGLVGGVLIAVALMMASSGGDMPEEQDGWATQSEEAEQLVQEPEISIPTESELASPSEPPPLYPGYATEPPSMETAQLAGGELDQTAIGVPYYNEPLAADSAEAIDPPSIRQPVVGWPDEATSGSYAGPELAPANGYSSEGLRQNQSNSPTSTYSPSQDDYRSSMYPPGTESYRTGMLETNRNTSDGGSSILDGNIEIPPTTSLR